MKQEMTLNDFLMTLNEEQWVKVLDNSDNGYVFMAEDFWDNNETVMDAIKPLLSIGVHNVSAVLGTEETDGEPCIVVCMNPHE